MKPQNNQYWEDKLKEKQDKREKKKRPGQKVSGSSVKKLQKLIIGKKHEKN